VLTLAYRCSEENIGGEDEYWSDYEEFLRHAGPPVIMPVEAEEEADRRLVIICVWNFESTRLSVIKNIV
jgi:hypothetical protein